MVEHSIGNGEVHSSTLCGSTSHLLENVDFVGNLVLGAAQKCHTDMVSLKRSMTLRSRSKIPQFRVRVPAHALSLKGKRVLLHMSERAGQPFVRIVRIGETVEFSLDTRDEYVAHARQDDALSHLRKLFDLTAAEPAQLSHKDLVALSGEVYRIYVTLNEADPGETSSWRYHKALSRAVLEGRIGSVPAAIFDTSDAAIAVNIFPGEDDLTAQVDALPAGQHDGIEERFGLLADFVLIRHRIHLASQDRQRFLRMVGTASLDAGWQLRRISEYDYSDDPKALRFPAIDAVSAIRPKVTFADLVTGWSKEAASRGLSKRTVDNLYPEAIERFKKFIKHDDPAKVTDDDILAFKLERQKTVKAKTWKDSDLPPIKAIFQWAVKNKKLLFNPAAEVTGERVKRVLSRPPDFSDDEASSVFRACLAYQGGKKEDPKTSAALKWVPILQAYTGTRVGEIIQLRKKDVRMESGFQVLRLSPDAGTVKGGRYRDVPLHSHPIELGFLQFVERSKDGALFATSDADGDATGLNGVYKRVRDFVRGVVTDPGVQPTHGWRHRFKTICLEDGHIAERTIDKIQGQVSTKNASGGYGCNTVKAMANALARFPHVQITAVTTETLGETAGPLPEDG